FFHRAGPGQAARLRKSQQFLVGTRVPEKKRKTRSQFQIGEGEIRISPNPTIEKIRTREGRGHDLLNSLIEGPSAFPRAIVELHETRAVLQGDRPSEGPMRQVFRDLTSAGGFSLSLRVANEDEVAAGSLGNTRGIKRSADHNAVNEPASPRNGRARAAFGQFFEKGVCD